MKKFILKTLIFLLAFVTIITFVVSLVNSTIRKNARFVIAKQSSNIILGHSQTQEAFNDTLIKDFSNYSHAGEPYFYTYTKLQKFLEHNKTIKNVLIGFSNNILFNSQENLMYSASYLNEFYLTNAPFMSNNQKWYLFCKNSSSFLKASSLALSINFNIIKTKNYDYSKLLYSSNFTNLIKPDTFFTNNKNQIIVDTAFSTIALKSLDKIIALCNKKNITLYLLRTPLHKNYFGFANEAKLQFILQNQYKNISFLDFSALPLANKYFRDFNHLNYYGATKFSIWFNQLIKNGLLHQQNKQAFIDQQMKIFSLN